MRILGIDPSLTSTGLALVEEGVVVDTTRVRSKNKGHDRVQDILDTIESYIWQGRRGPDEDPPAGFVVGIEGVAMGAKGSSVSQIFGLWHTITHQLWQWQIPYYVVAPTARVKYATGNGRDGKDQVLAAAIRRYMHLVEITGNDIADAVLVAAMGTRHYRQPALEESLPQVNLSALEKVAWPE